MIELTKTQNDILASGGNILVIGGPGSGKTTISILKATKIAQASLLAGQMILFLSFARATVSRVIETIEHEQQIPDELKKLIMVETYHSFFWQILKTHGYLIGLPRRLWVLTPPKEAIVLSSIRSEYKGGSKLSKEKKEEKLVREREELMRIAKEEGGICFDLFAPFVGQILHGSERIRRLISNIYPFIFLDEFQDTNADQWNVIKAIGLNSTLIALADPEQRIYDFAGADPKRLDQFRDAFKPKVFDLGNDNHRSSGTEILTFGNDILSGKFRNGPYKGIECHSYEPNANQAWTALIIYTLKARERLVKSAQHNWSLAILVPTKRMTRMVSDAFKSPPAKLPVISHFAVIDEEAIILAAEVIAFLMQPNQDSTHFTQFIKLICNYFHGKGGNAPSKTDLEKAERIQNNYAKFLLAVNKSLSENNILKNLLVVYEKTRDIVLTGNPDNDWCSIRDILEKGECQYLREIAHEVRNLGLLKRRSQLCQALSQNWRENGSYLNALEIVQRSFIQEHFATTKKPETGIIIMNMHKAKGKQFDEVIIFEGWPRIDKGKIVSNPDRIVKNNICDDKELNQARFKLRVSVTRAKKRTTILTPRNDPCVLLHGCCLL
ncbi:MAG: UvrD-helicase domain-containing protein [Firmicutes bacterium]|nr:UvrD-helicase domain-containing protein [Bacillota bacterium]